MIEATDKNRSHDKKKNKGYFELINVTRRFFVDIYVPNNVASKHRKQVLASIQKIDKSSVLMRV